MNNETKRIQKTKEEKSKDKEKKKMEKEQRKMKSLLKATDVEKSQHVSTKSQSSITTAGDDSAVRVVYNCANYVKVIDKESKVISKTKDEEEKRINNDQSHTKINNNEQQPSPSNAYKSSDKQCKTDANVNIENSNAPPKERRHVRSSDRVSFSETTNVRVPTNQRLDDDKIKRKYNKRNPNNPPEEQKKVVWFKHLLQPDRQHDFIADINNNRPADDNNEFLHPGMLDLGKQFFRHNIRGSTLRCQLFLRAIRQLVLDFELKTADDSFSVAFSFAFDKHVNFISQCRTLSAPMKTAISFLKLNLPGFRMMTPEQCKESLCEMIDQFLNERIDIAHKSIELLPAQYVHDNNTILVYSHSELVFKSLLHLFDKYKKLEVFVVSSYPDDESRRMIDRLQAHNIQCVATNLAAIPYLLSKIDIVLLGAAAVYRNGSVISSCGSASIANAARSFRKPVIVCAETCKFQSCSQLNAFAFNELGDPDTFIRTVCQQSSSSSCCEKLQHWREKDVLINPLDILYDVIQPTIISVICCELGAISPTAVSFVIEMKQPIDS